MNYYMVRSATAISVASARAVGVRLKSGVVVAPLHTPATVEGDRGVR
jgi:hypothetical protein